MINMLNVIKEYPIDKKIHNKKINETNIMLNETLKIINNYKKNILNKKIINKM